MAALGLSSGKIMKYLSYGRPVVVNRFPATSLLIEEHGIGASADPGYFKEALERVSSNYASFREAARRTYDEIGDFKGPYNSLIDSIVVAP